jgi:hypothetical protein
MTFIKIKSNRQKIVKYFYQEYGTVSPYIIHGWATKPMKWEYQLNELSKHNAVLPMTGRTVNQTVLGKSYDYDTLADDLNEVITQLKRQSCTSWFSMGGGEMFKHSRVWMKKLKIVLLVP